MITFCTLVIVAPVAQLFIISIDPVAVVESANDCAHFCAHAASKPDAIELIQ
jgi:hypothetical protein